MTEIPDALARDAARLDALERYAIIDTPAEAGFDDAVFLAAELCGAPMALISFPLADRQWFKARRGFAVRQTGLDRSICVHALAEPDLLVIPDLAADPRTRTNPSVLGSPDLRFYAGAPLRNADGVSLGTLCVLDVAPRPGGLSEGQAAGLRALARQVMAQLETRRAALAEDPAQPRQDILDSRLVRLGESALLMRLAIDGGDIGIWDYDLVRDRLEWDGRTRALFGLGPDETVTYDGTFLPRLHPGDRAPVDAAVRAVREPQGPGILDVEYRVVLPDGGQRWLAARGRLVVAGGRASRIVGTVRDVTLRREAALAIEAAHDRYRLVTRATSDAIRDWDLVADTVEWNEALATAYGWSPQEAMRGSWWRERLHPSDRARVAEDLRSAISGGAGEWSLEYRLARADGTYAEVYERGSIVRGPDGTPRRLIGALLDVTERNRAEAQFRAVFEGANVGIVVLDPRSLKALRVNAKLCAIWGAPADAIVGHSVARWTPDEDATARDLLHRRLAAGEILQETLEKRYRRADGRIIWARVNLVSQVVGDAVQVTAMIEDITQERLAEARSQALVEIGDALRDAAGREAMLSAALAVVGRTLGALRVDFLGLDFVGRAALEGFWERPDAAGRAAPGADRLLPTALDGLRAGLPLAVADIAAEPRFAADAPAYAALGVRALIAVPLAGRGRLAAVLAVHEGAPRTWTPGEIAFVREVAERIWGELGRMQAEDQQTLRNRELSHRLKNTLAMVQAIVSQTLRNPADLDAAKEALAARLVALGKAHDILLTGDAESAGIEAVIAGALVLHDDRQPGRFTLEGPGIALGPKAALSLSLMMHELATNAAKYGALSVPDGRVVVTWWTVPSGLETTVHLVWTEMNGPPVAPPGRKGFGSRLIERGLAGAVGGMVGLDYLPEGLVCRFAAPLAGLQAAE